ncbi:general secretion pathway protein GspB [Lysobacter solisilvae (ex Woo and Kim 2020)]|uniref:General secretion pathway protein GspB n=1 Tax=Agrilutibacter terrestris TaxID=2865112 RepID=A0A7H0FVD5_9GAMM|nr:general secretion pathway protein GspB [Lysobacter terrestris]QNP40001.1 general secretion pathway protein GspB [Lysobacter terrestris]
MSLILEALRKSEAERRRGQAPDLLTEAAPAVPAPRAGARARHLIPLAAGGTVLAAVVLVLLWSRTPTEPESAATAGVAAGTARAADASVAPPRPLQPPRPLPAAPPAATTTASTPVAQAAAAITAPSRNDDDAGARIEDLAPAGPAPTPALPASSPPASSPPVATAAFTSPDLPLRLSDLSTDERQALPPLKVSMHMWASEAANRFAIIDGTRVNEGDRIGEATVTAIQQDGVMLAWRGRRISLPIR